MPVKNVVIALHANASQRMRLITEKQGDWTFEVGLLGSTKYEAAPRRWRGRCWG